MKTNEFNIVAIGKRIKEIRNELELTQKKFANLIGAKARSTVNNWESGRRLPNVEQLIKIAKVGNCFLDWLVLGEGEKYESLIIKQLAEREKEIRNLKKENYNLKSQAGKIHKAAEELIDYKDKRKTKTKN